MGTNVREEKRRHPRFSLDLPLDYRIGDGPSPYGGVALDGGEGGLLIQCFRSLPIGTKLDLKVMFPKGFELTDLEASVEVVRKHRREKGGKGYRYGLKLVQIEKGDRRKLKYILNNGQGSRTRPASGKGRRGRCSGDD